MNFWGRITEGLGVRPALPEQRYRQPVCPSGGWRFQQRTSLGMNNDN
ncbi:hypothetical protein P3339_01045 [Microbulbifer sp. MLAF003]|nr:hypothetical protein [Microbulbifer sp. MLAF003]WHI51450.1 hypothetical protein P3339_01045 [Microbulbifer sp. MLAF003]